MNSSLTFFSMPVFALRRTAFLPSFIARVTSDEITRRFTHPSSPINQDLSLHSLKDRFQFSLSDGLDNSKNFRLALKHEWFSSLPLPFFKIHLTIVTLLTIVNTLFTPWFSDTTDSVSAATRKVRTDGVTAPLARTSPSDADWQHTLHWK